MITILVESIFFFPKDILTLGCGLSLNEAYDEQFKAVFVATLAICTGSWIGANLNFKLLRFLFRDKAQAFFNKSLALKCLDKMIEEHGLIFIALLRLNPIYVVHIMI